MARTRSPTTSRWLKRIVGYCIGMLTGVVVASYVSAWFGVDTVDVMTVACGVFGGELLITCVIKVLEKPKKSGEETEDGKGDVG